MRSYRLKSMMIGKAGLCVAAIGAPSMTALGQANPDAVDLPPIVTRDLPRSELQVLLGTYLPRLGGEVSLGNTAEPFNIEEELDLDASEPIFNGELYLRKDQVWEIAFGGFDFSTDAIARDFPREESFGDVVIDDGDDVRSTFDLTSFWFEIVPGAWRAYGDDDPQHPDPHNMTWDGRYMVDLRLMPRLGIRTFDIEQTMENLDTGTREDVDAAWLAFYGGLAAEMQYRPEHATPMLDLFELELGVNAGPALGGDGGFMTEVRAGINWHFSPNAGATIGYRLVGLFVEDDEYELDGALAGLYFAASLRF